MPAAHLVGVPATESSAVSQALEKLGYGVKVLGQADLALKAAKAAGPDLIILDLMMPNISGLEMIRNLADAAPNAVIVAAVRQDEPQDAKDAIEAGASDYLASPIDVDLLLHRVRMAIQAKPAPLSHSAASSGLFEVPLPEIHDKTTGRIDASRVADYLGVPLKRLATALDIGYTTVHKTPSAAGLQRKLGTTTRILEILHHVFDGNRKQTLAWLNRRRPELEGDSPLDVILQGEGEAVLTVLESAVAGLPT